MQNENHRNILLFLILLVLIVIAFLIARNDRNVAVAPISTLPTNQIYSNQDVLLDEEDLQEPEPKPTPEDPTVTFLKTFFKYENIIPEIRECEQAGIDFTAVTYDGGGIADGGWTIYETNTHEVAETCGGFTAEPMPTNSFCRTTLPSCTTVFKEGVVDIYNLD